jgi:hypothetical protein
VPTLYVEFDPPEPCPHAFAGDTADLVYFLSFAFSARYGATHELSRASLLLRGEFKIDLRPLLAFADREVEEPIDERELERAWQAPAPLAECCRQVVAAFDSGHAGLRELTAGFPALRDRLEELWHMAEWAAERGARVRLSYSL